MPDVVRLPARAVRYRHEFHCRGCDADVLAFVHFGPPDLCHLCQELGPEMAKALRDRRKSTPPEPGP